MYTNVIYIDILVVLNLYVSFFLIKASDIILHRRTNRLNIILGVLAGGITSLAALLPEMGFAPTVVVKIVSCIIISFFIFGFKSKYVFMKNTLIFLMVNFVFAGMMLFLRSFLSPAGMVYSNGFFYFNISFPFIAISTAIAYACVKAFRYIMDVKFSSDKKYTITIKSNNGSVELRAFPDTGNTLNDFYSGLPVIICNKESCGAILSDRILNFNFGDSVGYHDYSDYRDYAGIRIIPYSTIGNSGIIPVFRPDSIEIESKSISALIGVTDKKLGDEVDAVFNPKLLI